MTPTGLDQTRTLLEQQHLIGLAPRPIDLLPMLRLGILERLWTCEAADPGWEQAFATAGDSLETASGIRARWRGPDVDALLTAATQVPARTSVLAAYTLTSRWRAAAEASPHLRLPPRAPVRMPAQASEKIAMRSWLARLGVPVPESLVVDAGQYDFDSLSRRLGPVVVLQDPYGSGGAGTELVSGADDLEAAHRKHPRVRRWLASRWAGDTTINLHGLVPVSGPVAVSAPSLQLSGIAEIGAGFGEYGGSDFGAPQELLTRTVIDQCASLARRIGLSLSGMGHVGMFGVDMAIDGDAVAVIEVNARVQASTWLLGEGEIEAGTVPMLCRHFLALTGHRTDDVLQPSGPHAGCTLIVRHTGTAPVIAGSSLQPGVYDLAAELAWRRGGIGLLDCGPGEVAIGDLPRPGSLVEPGGTLARLTARTPLTTDSGRKLGASAVAVVDEVRRRTELSGAPAVRAGT